MALTVRGVVRQGVVIPEVPLPEGESVEIVLADSAECPPDLKEELASWNRASDKALDLVERMAQEMERDEKG